MFGNKLLEKLVMIKTSFRGINSGRCKINKVYNGIFSF